MPFYRFEDFKSHRFNPHLSTAEGPVIEGEFMYFRMVTKCAGTGSELQSVIRRHYGRLFP